MACEFEGPSYCHLGVKSKAYSSLNCYVIVQGRARSWWYFLLWLLKLSILFSCLELTEYVHAFVNSRKLKRAYKFFHLKYFEGKDVS